MINRLKDLGGPEKAKIEHTVHPPPSWELFDMCLRAYYTVELCSWGWRTGARIFCIALPR